jgi:hypothetical protein
MPGNGSCAARASVSAEGSPQSRDYKATIGKNVLSARCLIHWEIVHDFAGLARPTTDAFQFLDQLLLERGATAIRLCAGESQRAVLTSVSVLVAKPQSTPGQVQIKGISLKDAPVLFLSAAQPASEINSLLAVVAERAPHSRPKWIGIPTPTDSHRGSSCLEIATVESSAHHVGTMKIRNGLNKTATFGLYPLKQEHSTAPGLEPVKLKIPEPQGNLPARGRWFRRRSGGP